MRIKKALDHFFDFHKGKVNIALHIIGFAGIFYSVIKFDWLLFALSFIVVEAGHVYNHVAGIKKYDFRLKVILLRLLVFLIVLIAFYFVSR